MTPKHIHALELAARFKIKKTSDHWIVPSQTRPIKYSVRFGKNGGYCSCPAFDLSRKPCKHVLAVQIVMEREKEQAPVPVTSITETFEVTKQKTYPQNWIAYNAAQVEEKDRFQEILYNLCSGVVTPPQLGRGERRLPLSDAIFAAVFKVYSTMSARHFMSDLRETQKRGYIARVPHYNSVLNYLENPDLRPILTSMIELSAVPLKAIECDFAVDSSGFGLSRFFRWYDHKYGVVKDRRDWVKVHLMCGTKTKIVTAVEIHSRDAADSPLLPPLLDTTRKTFGVSEVSADKGYLSYSNAKAITDAGATPLIAFKKNSGPGDYRKEGAANTKAWTDMYYHFMFRREDFLRRYHLRSNVESTFSMMKRKFGDSLRSKTDTAMVNEALCKILCHNLVVLIHEAHELGIRSIFNV